MSADSSLPYGLTLGADCDKSIIEFAFGERVSRAWAAGRRLPAGRVAP
jgi:hypothetical protein